MLNSFFDSLNKFTRAIRAWIPFTLLNTVWRMLDKRSKSILDVGCGKGQPMKFINRNKKYYTVGVDIFEPYIKICKEQRIHNEYLLCDIHNMPFPEKSFDIVLCMEVLEHMNKEEGNKLLKNLEKIARKQVILTTPVGMCEQDEIILEDGNPFQVHKSGWYPDELKKLGYKIRGTTIKCLGGRAETINCSNKLLRPFGYLLWILTCTLAYFYPKMAADMICIKNIRE